MAELIVKEIVNPFRQEDKISQIELDLYSKLLKPNKKVYDNSDIAQDLFSQLIDIKDNMDKSLN